MIELFHTGSPNVFKVMIALEELALPYELVSVDLSKGDHHDPANIAGSITGKLPVLRDGEPADGGPPMTIFESGAILQYLAEKTGRLTPGDLRQRSETMQWLFWQMGGLGPISGQCWHFRKFAPRIEPQTDFTYPERRYSKMLGALWGVMDRRLADAPYLATTFSVADIACYPWIIYLGPNDDAAADRAAYPNVARWRDAIAERPATVAAYRRNAEHKVAYPRNEKGVAMAPWEGILKHVIVA